jgi:hypothetical protein
MAVNMARPLTEKMAVFAPIPSANAVIAGAANQPRATPQHSQGMFQITNQIFQEDCTAHVGQLRF